MIGFVLGILAGWVIASVLTAAILCSALKRGSIQFVDN